EREDPPSERRDLTGPRGRISPRPAPQGTVAQHQREDEEPDAGVRLPRPVPGDALGGAPPLHRSTSFAARANRVPGVLRQDALQLSVRPDLRGDGDPAPAPKLQLGPDRVARDE